MNNTIPYQFFGSNNSEKCIFLHGNGFPPNTYQSFLKKLGENLAVYAMYQRPFWETDINPNQIKGWDIFKNDAIEFLKQNKLNNSIGIGHSMGAVLILLIEIQNPGTFKKIFLLDPVITSWFKSLAYKGLFKIKLIDKFHPMIQRTNHKKMEYSSRKSIYQNYRRKNIFSRLDDYALNNYIDSIIIENKNKIKLKLSKKWENTIYRNGSMHDFWIWKNIKKIDVPVYVITPNNDEFGHFNYGRKLKSRNNKFLNLIIKDSSHLFPLEKAQETSDLILSKITF